VLARRGTRGRVHNVGNVDDARSRLVLAEREHESNVAYLIGKA